MVLASPRDIDVLRIVRYAATTVLVTYIRDADSGRALYRPERGI